MKCKIIFEEEYTKQQINCSDMDDTFKCMYGETTNGKMANKVAKLLTIEAAFHNKQRFRLKQ